MKEPVYRIIENDIKKMLETRQLKQGDLVPSEKDLKEKYDVSRMTVRQALNNLVNEGYLYRHKGKGTFVNQTKIEKRIHGLLGFTEDMRRMNRKVSNKIITIDVIKSDDEISAKLFINKGDEVYLVKRIRYANDIPVLYEELYAPKMIFSNLNKEIMLGSFYQYIEHELNLKIDYTIQNIEAKLATDKIAEYLEVTNGSPILYITLNTFLDNNRPFEYVKSYYRGDQYRLVQHAIR